MQFTVSREELLQELSLSVGIVEKKTTLEILTYILLEVQDNKLSITATDLDLTYSGVLPVQGGEEGSCAVTAQKLYEIFRLLPSKDVQVTLLPDQTLLVEAGTVRYQLRVRPYSDYPKIPQVKEGVSLTLDHGILRKALQRTLPTVAVDEYRYQYGSILFHFLDHKMEVVSTDGHRLSYVCVDLESLPPEGVKDFLLSRKAAQELVKIQEAGHVAMTLHDPFLQFAFPNRIVIARKGQGEIPDYHGFLENKGDKVCEFHRKDLIEAIRRVSVVSATDFKGVKFIFEEGRVVLDGSHPDYGQAKEELPMEHDLAGFSIGFNYQYLLDFLQTMEEEKVKAYFSTPKEKAFWIPVGETNFDHQYIVMPMSL